ARVDMAVGGKDVEPAVIVVVEKAGSPAQKGIFGIGELGADGDVGEIAAAIVAIEGVVIVGKVGDVKADAAAVIVVAGGDAHGSLFAAVVIEGEAGKVADVFERAVVLVAVEIFGHRIIGHCQVEPAIVVNVHKNRGETVIVVRVRDAGFDAHVGEG